MDIQLSKIVQNEAFILPSKRAKGVTVVLGLRVEGENAACTGRSVIHDLLMQLCQNLCMCSPHVWVCVCVCVYVHVVKVLSLSPSAA